MMKLWTWNKNVNWLPYLGCIFLLVWHMLCLYFPFIYKQYVISFCCFIIESLEKYVYDLLQIKINYQIVVITDPWDDTIFYGGWKYCLKVTYSNATYSFGLVFSFEKDSQGLLVQNVFVNSLEKNDKGLPYYGHIFTLGWRVFLWGV